MNAETGDWLKSRDCAEYFELLGFPTVGANPLRLADCARAATWLKKWLEATGAEAEVVVPRVSAANGAPLIVPVVFGEIRGGEGEATVLVYGHYDVQPPDPEDQWHSSPFEPTVRDGRIYCRGAQDDKGQFFAFLCGVREWLSANPDPSRRVTVKFVLDGQEESGSGTLFRLFDDKEFRRRIAADVLLVSDTSAAAGLRPAIVAGLRGVNHFTVKLVAANRDLHSGEYGGIAPNAAQGMARLMASLHNPDGSIAVAGFCDGVVPPTPEELAKAEEGLGGADGCEAMYAADIGTEPCGGRSGASIAQRNGFEPTIEINGIHSGYGGPGSKTVIPCEAIAKLSTRLVPGQNPRRTFDAIKAHLLENCPRGMKVSFPDDNGLSPALRLPLSSPLFRVAAEALAEMDPRGPVFQWDGASIPIVSSLKDATGAAPLLVGWGQPEDRIHAPDESYSPEQFRLAKTWAVKILSALSASQKGG